MLNYGFVIYICIFGITCGQGTTKGALIKSKLVTWLYFNILLFSDIQSRIAGLLYSDAENIALKLKVSRNLRYFNSFVKSLHYLERGIVLWPK